VSTNKPGTPSLPAAAASNVAPVSQIAVAAAPFLAAFSCAAPVAVVAPAIAAPAIYYATPIGVPVLAKIAIVAALATPGSVRGQGFAPSGTPYGAWFTELESFRFEAVFISFKIC
ncbi:hypothetical protein BIW11_00527, partial [Tropilaelaps mercedesae]